MFTKVTNRRLSVVIDTSVIAHKIADIVSGRSFDTQRSIAYTRNAIAHIASLDWLAAYADIDPAACNVIWVKDTKVNGKYWRNDYLASPDVTLAIAANQPDKGKGVKARRRLLSLATPETPHTPETTKELQTLLKDHQTHYKAGRRQASDLFMSVRSEVYGILDRNGWNVLEKPLYEADDLAATVCVLNQMLPYDEQHHILLATVDTDWMGLIDRNVAWICTTGYPPRLRHSMESVNEWATRRLKTTLETPSDIWRIKTLQGDKSDNLPVGTPIDIIDLKQPPVQHRLWNDPAIATKVNDWLLNPTGIPISAQQVKQVRKFFASNTVRAAIPAFNPDYDVFVSTS